MLFQYRSLVIQISSTDFFFGLYLFGLTFALLQVYGLDINPRAIKVARINLYLNSLDKNGFPIYDDEGKTLLERVEFHESDLLSYCREHNIILDRIIACIPQVCG